MLFASNKFFVGCFDVNGVPAVNNFSGLEMNALFVFF